MNNYPKLFCTTLFLLMISMVVTQKYQNRTTIIDGNLWERLGRMTGLFVQSCWLWSSHEQQNIFPLVQNCLKEKTLTVLTKTLQEDSIKILNGIELVKIKDRKRNFSRKMQDNSEESDWESRILDSILDVFETHTLKIHLENLVRQHADVNEARFRRHRRGNMMMSLMMFGMVAMGMLLIPMGFKFLTVLGAKALLLAKMALILTSIQGLKKFATSGLNYGLYHTPNPWHYDRHGSEDIPDEQLDYLHHHKHLRS